jgi:hypothetical protein
MPKTRLRKPIRRQDGMLEAFVITPATRSAPLNVVGEQITVLAPGSRTGGYEIFRHAGPEARAAER